MVNLILKQLFDKLNSSSSKKANFVLHGLDNDMEEEYNQEDKQYIHDIMDNFVDCLKWAIGNIEKVLMPS